MVRDLPAHVFIELGKFLNPKSSKNWVTLAGYLEFTTNEIKNFELEVNEATQNVLYQWGQKDSSTVDFLINVLKKMKRDDCVQVLKPWETDEAEGTVRECEEKRCFSQVVAGRWSSQLSRWTEENLSWTMLNGHRVLDHE